jgi:hypothetical protein
VTIPVTPIADQSPRLIARIAGGFWLVTFVAGSLALFVGRGTSLFTMANFVAPLAYLVAALAMYGLLRPVNRTLSLIAAAFGVAGCLISLLRLAPVIHVRDLVFFGVQCLLIGILIYRSTFLPRFLGVLMMLAGLGWLTNLWPALANSLAPYSLMPGIFGEGVLIVWLLVKGVDVQRWREEAAAG